MQILRRFRHHLAVPSGFLLLALLLYGRHVIAHPGRSLIGTGVDPQIFVWSLAWWPYAVLHGLNPIVSHVVWAPVGVNLAWTTSVAGIALPLSPVTLLFGPVVAYNVAAIALPALAATTGYLLCRRITRHTVGSLLGGAFFGFSPYMAGHEEGHLHMSSVFLLPLLAILVLDRLNGKGTPQSFAVRFGLLIAWQLLLSTEVVLTASLALTVVLALTYASVSERRAAVRSLTIPLAGAYALAGLVTAPFAWYALRHFETASINRPADFPADLLNLVVPTRLAWLTNGWTITKSDQFLGNLSENGAYVGLPALLIVVVYLSARRRTPAGRVLAVSLALAVIAELGTRLHVGGQAGFVLPWRLVADVPGLSNVLPVRLALFTALGVAVVIASFVASGPGTAMLRAGAAAVALIVILPAPNSSAWHGTIDRPRFFTGSLITHCLSRDEIVLALPYPNQTSMMVWQAEAKFRFRLANGNLRPDPPAAIPNHDVVVRLDSGGDVTGITTADILRVAHSQGVSTILVDDNHAEPWHTLLAGNVPAQHVGGVTLYRLASPPAGCHS